MDTLYDQDPFYNGEDINNFVEENEAFLEQWDIDQIPELNELDPASENAAFDDSFVEVELPALGSGDDPIAEAQQRGSRQDVNMPLPPHGPIPTLQSIERGDPTLSTDADHRFTATANPLVYYGFDEDEASNYQHVDPPTTASAAPPLMLEATYDPNWIPEQSLQSMDFQNYVIAQIEQLKDEMARRSRKMDRMFTYLEELQSWTERYHDVTDRLIERCGLAEEFRRY